MTNFNLQTQCETILHFWNNGTRSARSAREIHKTTKIPIRTIYNNTQKTQRN
ncbi:12782_t:CDS:1, partial [Ambispora leptoticha]